MQIPSEPLGPGNRRFGLFCFCRNAVSARIGTSLLAGVLVVARPGAAEAFMDETRLIDLRAGAGVSASVRSYQSDGYQLSDGTPVIFGDWYRADWPDVHISFVTPIRKNLGFLWGFGTGERGGQYTIDPSLRLGFVAVEDLSESETLSLSISGRIGGRLTERPCTANYGAIGGTVQVNCRLAATPMRPAETLDYLLDEPPTDRFVVQVTYRFEF